MKFKSQNSKVKINTSFKIKILQEISKEIGNCKICKKGKNGLAVPGEGSPNARIVFIGEAPGREEAKTGRPFIGRSGKFLRSFIKEIGLDEKDVYITSPVKYLPDRGTPTDEDIAHGRIHLLKQIEVIDPKIIVLLGKVSIKGMLNNNLSVINEHGKTVKKNGKIFFTTVHPAAAIRFPKVRKIFKEDFEKLKIILKKKTIF